MDNSFSKVGKSVIGEKLKVLIEKEYGTTLIIHGDDIRNIFKFKFYSRSKRLKLGKSYSDLCKLISEQGLHVVYTTVGLFYELHKYNRRNLKNYIEIFIKTDLNKLKKNNQNHFIKQKLKMFGVLT